MGGFFMVVRKYREDDYGEFVLLKVYYFYCWIFMCGVGVDCENCRLIEGIIEFRVD